MLEMAPLMLENEVKKSQFCVVSPLLLRLEDGVLACWANISLMWIETKLRECTYDVHTSKS